MKCLSSWTGKSHNSLNPIPDGFKVITSGLQCIILIHSNDHIRTLKFQDISVALKENIPQNRLYDYQFEDGTSVQRIFSTSSNTYGLLDDGRLFYFVSFKAVEIIPNVDRVRAISDTESGFALIRNTSATDVLIEFYTDRGSDGRLKKYKKIPLGWNEKWEFERNQEKSVLQLLRMDNDRTIALFSHFIAVEDAEEEERMATQHGGYSKVVVFSINCSLFCVFYENAKEVHSGVNSIRTFLAEIEAIRIFPGIICVFLANGVVQLLYVDEEDNSLVEDSIFLGVEGFQSIESVAERNCFFVSDRGQICFKVSLRFDEGNLQWTVEKIPLQGVVGISHLSSQNVILLITENSFIYAIELGETNSIPVEMDEEKNPRESVEELQKRLSNLSAINSQIEEERTKTVAINILRNPEIIRENCGVLLSFKSYTDFYTIPSFEDETSEQLFDVNLEFQFKPELEAILKSQKWTLNIVFRHGGSSETVQETIELTDQFLKRRKVKILRGNSRNSTTISGDVEVFLVGSVDKILTNVPVNINYNLDSLIEVLEEDPETIDKTFHFTIQSESQTIISKLLDMIVSERIFLQPFVISLGQSAVVVRPEENSCSFQSPDQFALQLLKKFLLLEGHSRGIWSSVTFEPKETLQLCQLTARHALFMDDNVDLVLPEIYKDLRDCKIKLS